MLTNVIALLINLLPGLLQSVGVSPQMSDLIGKLGAAVPVLITSLAQGKGVPDEIIAILTAFQSEIQALQSGTNLDADALAIAATLDQGITEALLAYEQSKVTTDPSNLTPLPTNF